MRIGILGAGITGLSLAKLLRTDFDVEILERNKVSGGIARTKDINGVAYHMVGGHCFNSKHKDVLDFVFNEVLPLDQWRKVQRNSQISFKGHEIPYPIEFSVKQIFDFDPELAYRITSDFISSNDDHSYENLEIWFRKKFGDTLAEEYFIPYNTKIWNNNPNKMSHSWVEDKLPIPNKMDFFESLLNSVKDSMPHSSFFYPLSNNQNTFIEALAEGSNITYEYNIGKIRFDSNKSEWIVNEDKTYDILISTIPLNILPTLLDKVPGNILDAASKLKYNSVSNVFWSNNPTDKTWTYFPENNTIFHRYIHIGSFFSPQQGYTITEVIGEKTFEEMVEDGSKDSFLAKPLDFNVSEHAYVVFDENYKSATDSVKDHLQQISLYSVGRFGEWEYYNMDICIKQSIELAKRIRLLSSNK